MTPLVLADWQLKHAKSLRPGERMQVWEPATPPVEYPEHGHARLDVLEDRAQIWWWNGVHERVGASQACPYGQPGDLLRFLDIGNLRLTGVRVATLGEMTCEDAQQAGGLLPSIFAERWNAQHPEHPWSSGRVCWALEMEAT